MKNTEEEKKRCLKEAELYETEAEFYYKIGANAIILQDKYNTAIQSYKKIGHHKDKISEIIKKINVLQKNIPNELKRINLGQLDLSESGKYYIEKIKNCCSFDEFFQIISPLTKPQSKLDMINIQKSNAKNSLLQYILEEQLINEKGMIITKKSEKEKYGSDFKYLYYAIRDSLYYFELNGAILNSCIKEFFSKQNIDFEFFDKILTNNPFTPNEHFHQFKRGILLGLESDWISFMHIILPQIENSLRNILRCNIKVGDDGIQEERDLNELLYTEEMKEILGEDSQFQLQILLVEKAGLNLRNKIAHGLISDDYFLSKSYAAPFLGHILFNSVHASNIKNSFHLRNDAL